ncbi:hypothetical protein [uncultured Granulicatella sp.]|uniref:hypothetical protein n=1 Tax=uncultured Granulicatella sp. TaxID=316089 RepID=UPI00262C88F1|nr:hypothetical protein [uncultured Granulicatella sp.]
MTKDYKYIHNRECLLKDWGKSMRFGKYFVEWYDEDDEESSEVFETKEKMFDYLRKYGIKE